jgi:cytochrome c-type biogenesis protein CcmH
VRARWWSALVVLVAALAAASALGFVAARGHQQPESRAAQAQRIAAGLHCPICKDLSVADSPAPLAQQMRQQIDQQLAAGRSPDEIRAGFVAAYGDSVLMSPPRHGLGGAAYYLPLAVVLGGALAAGLLLRRWRAAPSSVDGSADGGAALSAAQRQAVRRAVERLREEEA